MGFGATYGLDQVYLSGQYTADIPGGPTGLSVNTDVKAEVKAGATMSATFKYTGSFEALLWKTDDNTGSCICTRARKRMRTSIAVGQ